MDTALPAAAAAEWPCLDGIGARRCVDSRRLGRATPAVRPWIDLSVRGRAAEATLAAVDDAFRQDRPFGLTEPLVGSAHQVE